MAPDCRISATYCVSQWTNTMVKQADIWIFFWGFFQNVDKFAIHLDGNHIIWALWYPTWQTQGVGNEKRPVPWFNVLHILHIQRTVLLLDIKFSDTPLRVIPTFWGHDWKHLPTPNKRKNSTFKCTSFFSFLLLFFWCYKRGCVVKRQWPGLLEVWEKKTCNLSEIVTYIYIYLHVHIVCLYAS